MSPGEPVWSRLEEPLRKLLANTGLSVEQLRWELHDAAGCLSIFHQGVIVRLASLPMWVPAEVWVLLLKEGLPTPDDSPPSLLSLAEATLREASLHVGETPDVVPARSAARRRAAEEDAADGGSTMEMLKAPEIPDWVVSCRPAVRAACGALWSRLSSEEQRAELRESALVHQPSLSGDGAATDLSYRLLDFVVRRAFPASLRRVEWEKDAERLAALSELDGVASSRRAADCLERLRARIEADPAVVRAREASDYLARGHEQAAERATRGLTGISWACLTASSHLRTRIQVPGPVRAVDADWAAWILKSVAVVALLWICAYGVSVGSTVLGLVVATVGGTGAVRVLDALHDGSWRFKQETIKWPGISFAIAVSCALVAFAERSPREVAIVVGGAWVAWFWHRVSHDRSTWARDEMRRSIDALLDQDRASSVAAAVNALCSLGFAADPALWRGFLEVLAAEPELRPRASVTRGGVWDRR